MTLSPVRVLVVEDSATVRRLLVQMLTQDPGIEIVGTAADGQTAIDMIRAQRPDVVTMDINMPGMDGLEATRRIMAACPVPIIIVSVSARPEEVQLTFDALEAGAVAVLEKPYAPGHPEHERMAQRLRQMVRLMSEVRVVQRRISRPGRPAGTGRTAPGVPEASRAPASAPFPARTREALERAPLPSDCALRVVAVGASTGGPPALRLLLDGLPSSLPVALLVVQHIAPGFLDGMLAWLSQSTSFELRVAAEGDLLRPGLALFAPDGAHLCLTEGNQVTLSTCPPVNGVRPSISVLFDSVARHCGARGAGILLTGMGRDGAAELGRIAAAGGLTIAQDEASSVVHGMPGEALRLGHAQSILPPEKMPQALVTWAGGH